MSLREQPRGHVCSLRVVSPSGVAGAAHIKPRTDCSDAERRDFAHVVPMCLLGCDALFERCLVVVHAGKVKVRIRAGAKGRFSEVVGALEGRSTPAWEPDRFKYFRWHARQNPADLQGAV